MHDEHPARRCSSRAAPCGTCTPAQDEHLLRGCSSWAGSFRTFLAAGRRSAVAAGEFSGLLPRPADQREATSPRKARGQRTPMSLSFHYHFISFHFLTYIYLEVKFVARPPPPLAVPRRRMHAVPRHGTQRPAASSFRTFLAVGRRSAVAAGEFPGLLSRPAGRGAHPRWAAPSAGGRGTAGPDGRWPMADGRRRGGRRPSCGARSAPPGGFLPAPGPPPVLGISC